MNDKKFWIWYKKEITLYKIAAGQILKGESVMFKKFKESYGNAIKMKNLAWIAGRNI